MLSVENLSKSFHIHIRNDLSIEGFADVSFTAKPGQLMAVTGASGIGKSSLLKCIYRTYKPTGGSVMYKAADGALVDLALADDQTMLALRRAELGYISQFLHVIPRVAALDILTQRRSARGIPHHEAKEQAEHDLDRVGIHPKLWNMYPSTFSGGEKQRLNILLALAAEPRMLLLDEPTASLDPGSKEIILNLILDAKKRGTIMVGVFHDKDAVQHLADSRYDMRKNRLVAVS